MRSQAAGEGGELPVSTEGFTEFSESPDTRKVYVSSSGGDDQRDGLTPETAVKTIAAGVMKLRNGFPDWLLLKRGDAWTEGLGLWKLSGRSAAAPMVVTSYGDSDARPLLKVSDTGIMTTGGGGSPESMDYLAFTGLHFWAFLRDPDSPDYVNANGADGISWMRGTRGLLIEDCVFESFPTNIVIQNADNLGQAGIRLRRNILIDAYSPTAHSQGVYISGVTDALLEENIFDHNGWNEGVQGAERTQFNHNIYIQSNAAGVVIRNNIVLRGSSHGMQLRPGGLAEGNIVARNAIGILLAGDLTKEVEGLNNVVIEGDDIDPADGVRGWGIVLQVATSGRMDGNIVAHEMSTSGSPPAIQNSTPIQGQNNLVYEWGDGGASGPFVDPARSLASYNKTVGGPGTFEDFVKEVRAQSRQRWRTDYEAGPIGEYIREGFKLRQ